MSLRRADPVLVVGLGISCLAVLWTLLNLGARSLWWDELFTTSLASPATSTEDAMRVIRTDVHPPLYFFLVRGWLALLQSSDGVVVRAFNLIPYAIAAFVAFWAVRRRVEQPMIIWIALFAGSFGFLWYLQEGRMYATMIAQGFCACAITLDYQLQRERRINAGYVALLAVVFVIMPLGHWFSFAFSGGILIGLAIWALLEKRYRYLGLFVVLGLLCGGAMAAWIVFNFSTTLGAAGAYGGVVYGGALSWWGVRQALSAVALFVFTANPILIAAAGYGIWTTVFAPKRSPALIIILSAAVLLTLAIFIVSIRSPMYQPRNFLFLLPAMTLFAAIGLQQAFDRLKLNRLRQAIGLAVALLLSVAIAPFGSKVAWLELDEWRETGAYVSSQPGCSTTELPAFVSWAGQEAHERAMHDLLAQRLYGYYLAGGPAQVVPVMPDDRLEIDPDAACPVVLWVGHMPPDKADAHAKQVIGDVADTFERVHFVGHTLYLKRPAAAEVDEGGL